MCIWRRILLKKFSSSRPELEYRFIVNYLCVFIEIDYQRSWIHNFFLEVRNLYKNWLIANRKNRRKEEIVFALFNYEEKTKQKQQRLRKQIPERVSKSHWKQSQYG